MRAKKQVVQKRDRDEVRIQGSAYRRCRDGVEDILMSGSCPRQEIAMVQQYFDILIGRVDDYLLTTQVRKRKKAKR